MTHENKDISTILMDEQAIDRALQNGVAHALRRHKRLGESIAVWQDGRVVHLSAEEIPDLPILEKSTEQEKR